MRSWSALLPLVVLTAACPSPAPAPAPAPGGPRVQRVAPETVKVRDPELERRIARVELLLLEREAQVEDLQTRLEDARAEVVRAMAKLQTVASRAEAASGMAEAEVALQSLRSSASLQPAEAAQVARLVAQSSAEFDKQNYGGALYLATQAKALAAAMRARVANASRAGPRPGETPFALPIRLRVVSQGNVREGPGTHFAILFGVESGSALTGYSHTDEWIRITDQGGRSGWIFRSLVARP